MEGNEFSCRWKGVELCHIDENGEHVETEEFSVKDFMGIIKEKNMRLVNMDAYCDEDTNVKITEFKLVDFDGEVDFDTNLIDDIEFVSFE
jgi:hypothetical protein